MIKRILGILVAVFTVVVIGFAISGWNDFRSLIEPSEPSPVQMAEEEEKEPELLPADRPDSVAVSDVDSLQKE